jgi:hypothetical protein
MNFVTTANRGVDGVQFTFTLKPLFIYKSKRFTLLFLCLLMKYFITLLNRVKTYPKNPVENPDLSMDL